MNILVRTVKPCCPGIPVLMPSRDDVSGQSSDLSGREIVQPHPLLGHS
jgi:hypothetical protein